VNRDFYICGKTFDVEYLRQLMNPQQKIGKIQLSSKKTIISIIEGEFEETKFKLTSGIPGKHGKGGQSQGRFARKREEEVDAFLRKIYSYSKQLKVDKWIFEGDKEMVKRFKRINYQN
jgi:peptide chain release factor subunit 1